MKSTGMVRNVDQLGRIVIPKELRRTLHIREAKDLLEIYIEDKMIVLKAFDENSETSGIVRGVDRLGRIVLPIELRRKLDIVEERDALEIYIDDTAIMLRKYQPDCVFCGDAKNILIFKGKNICQHCLSELRIIK